MYGSCYLPNTTNTQLNENYDNTTEKKNVASSPLRCIVLSSYLSECVWKCVSRCFEPIGNFDFVVRLFILFFRLFFSHIRLGSMFLFFLLSHVDKLMYKSIEIVSMHSLSLGMAFSQIYHNGKQTNNEVQSQRGKRKNKNELKLKLSVSVLLCCLQNSTCFILDCALVFRQFYCFITLTRSLTLPFAQPISIMMHYCHGIHLFWKMAFQKVMPIHLVMFIILR